VYPVGAGNRFGFPNPEVVARTPGLHFTTAQGAIVAESDGRSASVRAWSR
jgi:beta-lactamase superfamily II metal-dependent hydrolase